VLGAAGWLFIRLLTGYLRVAGHAKAMDAFSCWTFFVGFHAAS
jgi:hypothetical protein